jgi:hypothetical protein
MVPAVKISGLTPVRPRLPSERQQLDVSSYCFRATVAAAGLPRNRLHRVKRRVNVAPLPVEAAPTHARKETHMIVELGVASADTKDEIPYHLSLDDRPGYRYN